MGRSVPQPGCIFRIVTSMEMSKWKDMLTTYPERYFANFLQRGIANGFRISFAADSIWLKSQYWNLLSAVDHLPVVQTTWTKSWRPIK